MEQEVIFSSEHVKTVKQSDGYYIESYRNGMSVEQFNKLMGLHPEIKIISFMAIKNALLNAPTLPAKFGETRERIAIEISSDELKAYVTLFVMDSELQGEKKAELVREILKKFSEKGILYGIKRDVLFNELSNNKKILVAEGIPPINGEDCVITLYKLKEVKPQIKEDGNVNHYELNLINTVKAGDWLGERIDPSMGAPGKTVKGNIIHPKPGKKHPLYYDKSSVKEVYENGVTKLYSLKSGAVHFEGERISVSDHLEITSNVDFKTGNIDFDGYVTVKGTVEDNFTVAANKDIEVLGDYGVGSAKEIVSRNGRIYIKGGIAGKNKSIIKSKKDIYTKFVSDAAIICEGSVHIGFYCLNSNITAKEVIVDSPKGQIIGGNIQAEIRVVSSIIGSPGEKRTYVSVKGFDRRALKAKLEEIVVNFDDLKNKIARIKQELQIYTDASQLTMGQLKTLESIKDNYFDMRNKLKELDDERRSLVNYLSTRGEGEITILKKAYPGTILEIKREFKEIEKETLVITYYIQDGVVKEI